MSGNFVEIEPNNKRYNIPNAITPATFLSRPQQTHMATRLPQATDTSREHLFFTYE